MSKGTILVVEDDIALLEGIRDVLELEDYTIIIASSGMEGLERLNEAEEPPDLIVSDIMMPKMNGYQFLDIVRADPCWISIPFIFLTAKGEKADIRLGKGLGVDDYIPKPFDSEDLLVAVNSRLKRARQLDALQVGKMDGLKRNILTILNHEFRTPLTYIVAYADMASRDVTDFASEEFASFLHGIQAGSERLRRLIENFIFLVELETGEALDTYNWRRNPYRNFLGLFDSVMSETIEDAEKRNITFKIIVPDTLPYVEIDQEYIQRALIYLVDNAIKFTDADKKSTVTLKAWATAKHVHLSVIDEGRGMPPQHLKQIFEPFSQIDREQYENQGAGSGLAIVHSIVEMHGGEVIAESVFGEGSTFTIVLPIFEGGDKSETG